MAHEPSKSPARTVIVGGTRGIGAAAARRLASDPSTAHDVVVWGRQPSRNPPDWLAALGARAAHVGLDHADVSDEAAVRTAMSRANADGSGLTGLVVSAGIWEPSPIGPGAPNALSAFARTLDVNLLGTVRCVAAFLEHLRPEVPTSIVLVGSTAGQRGEAGYGAYAASKAALAGLVKSWAVELAPLGARVNVVAPGWVDTDMTAQALGDPAFRAQVLAGIPRGRIASAEDLAGPIAFLLSDDSAHVTGTVLSVNGGAVLTST